MSAYNDQGEVFQNKKWAEKAVYAKKDIKKGKKIEADDLVSLRPYNPRKKQVAINDFYSVVGKKAKRNVKEGDYLKLSDT